MIEYFDKVVASIIAAMIALVGWLFKTVINNHKTIELLKNELIARDIQRKRDREEILEIKSRLSEMRTEIREDYREIREELRSLAKK